MDNILVNFTTTDQSGLVQGKKGLEEIIAKEGELYDKAKRTNDALYTAGKHITDASKAGKKDIEGLSTAMSNLSKSAAGGFGAKAIGDLQKALSGTNDEYKRLAIVLDAAKKKMADLKPNSVEWKQLNDQVRAGEQILKMFGQETDKNVVKTKSLKAELRGLKEEIARRTVDGESGADLDALIAKAGELDDVLKDVNQEIAKTGNDTRNIEGFIQVLGTGTAVVGGLAASQALLGGESEEFQQVLVKLNALMLISNSIQQVQSALQKESAASLFISNAQRKIATVQTSLQTAAESGGVVVRYAAVAAQKALNLVMAANPILLVVGAVIALGAAIYEYTQNTIEATRAQNELNNALFSATTALDAELAGYDNNNAKIIAGMKQRGATDEQITRQEINNSNLKSAAIQKEINNLKAKREAALNSDDEKVFETSKKITEEISTREKQITEITTESITKRADALRQSYLNSLKSATAYAEARVAQAKKGSEAELNAEIEAVKARKAQALNSDPNITAGEEYKIRKEAEKEIADLKFKYNHEALEDSLKAANAQVLAAKEGTKEELEAKLFALVVAREVELDDQQLTAEKKLEIDAKYQRQRADLQKEFNIRQIESEIAYTNGRYETAIAQDQLILTSTKSTAAEKAKAAISLAALIKSQDQAQFDNLDRLYEAGKLTAEEYYTSLEQLDKARIEKEIANEQQLQQAKAELRQRALDITKQLGDALFDSNMSDYQRDLDANQANFDRKIITEKEFNSKKEQIARQQAIQQRAKAVFDIGIDTLKTVFQIQAAAAVQTAALNPIGAAIALSQIPYVIGQGALTAGLLLAKKLRHGEVNIDGPGTTTSDSIPAMLSRGESVINAESTAKHKSALEAINNNRFEDYLVKFALPAMYEKFSIPQIPKGSERIIERHHGGSSIDYDRLGGIIGKQMAANPQVSVHVDENGLITMVHKGIDTIEYKNKKLLM